MSRAAVSRCRAPFPGGGYIDGAPVGCLLPAEHRGPHAVALQWGADGWDALPPLPLGRPAGTPAPELLAGECPNCRHSAHRGSCWTLAAPDEPAHPSGLCSCRGAR